jgi:4-amino-4-deoxy-L-arabinose transferase-like glycosyltransferase
VLRLSRSGLGGKWLKSPNCWALLALGIRLAAFASISVIGTAMERAAGMTPPAGRPSSVLQLLYSRTDFIRLTEDETAYNEMAKNIVAGRGFVTDNGWLVAKPGQPTAYAGAGYPLFVALWYRLFGSGNQIAFFVGQILLAALATYPIFWITREIAGTLAAQIAAAAYVFNPLLIWVSIAMMSEALMGPLVVGYLWLLHRVMDSARTRSLAWGLLVCLGADAAALAETRSISFSLALGALLVLWFVGAATTARRLRLVRCVMFAAVFASVCAPWAARNYFLWHRWIPFSTKSGMSAYMFNNSGLRVGLGRQLVAGEMPVDAYSPAIQGLPDESSRDAALMGLFWQFVRTQPLKFLGLVACRFAVAVLPVTSTESNWPTALAALWSKLPILVLLALSLVRFGKVPLAAALLPEILVVVCWWLGQSLAGPGLRFRSPADFAYSIIVGVLAAVLLSPGSDLRRQRLSA